MKCKKTSFRILAMILSILLFAGAFAGCSKVDNEPPKTDGNVKSNTSTTATATTATAVYPIKTDATLKFWFAWTNPNVKNLSEAPVGMEYQKKTGIKVEYIHPPANGITEAFNLMLASGDLPDIIFWSWSAAFPGGPEKAINDGYILKLNDVIDKYAPNLKAYYEANPEMEKVAKTDSGAHYNFPLFRQTAWQTVFWGPIIRKDWLDELELQIPTTIDDWHTMLTMFKEKKGAQAPLSYLDHGWDHAAFYGAYGVKKAHYLDDGKVVYGPVQPGFKEYLTTMKKWYDEGLLDKNFPTLDSKIVNANMTSEKTGATVAFAGGGMGSWLQSMKDRNPKYDLVAAPYPVLKKGDMPKLGQMDAMGNTGGAAISKSSKNVEIAARYLDYAYSMEGHTIANFGIENESYTMVNGVPQYTDLILNNPNKMTISDALSLYSFTKGGYAAVQDKILVDATMLLQQQKDAMDVWSQTDEAKHKIPQISFTEQESADVAKIMNEVRTLVDEMRIKFIIGAAPLSDFDKFVGQVEGLGIDKVNSIYQAAVERYNKR